MYLTEEQLNRANVARKRDGKKPLTRSQAEDLKRRRDDGIVSSIDLSSLLTTAEMPSHTHSWSSLPDNPASYVSPGGGDFGGGGASGSWSDSSPSFDAGSSI